MGSHTTYFCDYCNDDHDIQHGEDDGHAICFNYPVGDGWAEFQVPYTNSLGHTNTRDVHICAHCLADPDFEPKRNWKISEWDTASKENFEKGRVHADLFAHALETLGTHGRWGATGVTQVFDGHGYTHGPKLEDGSFRLVKFDWELATR